MTVYLVLHQGLAPRMRSLHSLLALPIFRTRSVTLLWTRRIVHAPGMPRLTWRAQHTAFSLQRCLRTLEAEMLAGGALQDAWQRLIHHVREALRRALSLSDGGQLPQQLPGDALSCPDLCSLHKGNVTRSCYISGKAVARHVETSRMQHASVTMWKSFIAGSARMHRHAWCG